jgi:S-adenosylmethionine:tRNA ribosyltransferase-isomerase
VKKSDFHFELPKHLIAQTPLADRASSRLMLLDRRTGNITHKYFSDILDYLDDGDCLVLNDTKVLPARIFSGNTEVLLLKDLGDGLWEALVKPGKKARTGDVLDFSGYMTGEVLDIIEGGIRIIRFTHEGIFLEILEQIGAMPLPPYITEKLKDQSRYQTVYAKHIGSAAAPTAGLHFTPELINAVEDKGVRIARITLHVGLGTFRPVKEDDITAHHMHSEEYEILPEQAELINGTKKSGKRVIAVGTTSARTLESAYKNGAIQAEKSDTSIYIYPGYSFKSIDGLITNFHLPESTLIMMVSAFATREIILNAYAEAVKEGYRFFSFGDAMMVI